MDAVGAFSLVTIADRGNRVGAFLQPEDRMGRCRRIIPPWIDPPIRSAGSFFPLGFRRQSFARPEAIADGVHPVDPAHRLVWPDDRSVLIREAPGRLALDGFHEFSESSVRDFKLIDVEAVEKHFMDWLLVVVALVAAHREF